MQLSDKLRRHLLPGWFILAVVICLLYAGGFHVVIIRTNPALSYTLEKSFWKKLFLDIVARIPSSHKVGITVQ